MSRCTRPSTAAPAPISVEQRHIKTELGGVPAQVAVFECLLPVKQQLMHVPEPVVPCSGLGCGCSGEGVRVDLWSAESAGRRGGSPRQALLNTFDLSKRLTRVRAFVIAILDQAAGRSAVDVIDRFVKRL
jgi:hypothetical protein